MTFNFNQFTASGVWTVVTDAVALAANAFHWTGQIEQDVLALGALFVTGAHVHGLHQSSGKGVGA